MTENVHWPTMLESHGHTKAPGEGIQQRWAGEVAEAIWLVWTIFWEKTGGAWANFSSVGYEVTALWRCSTGYLDSNCL